MRLAFQEYHVRRIVNVHRHVDPWFWDKYSATPYVGCRSGCLFCYLRGNRYLRGYPPESFSTLIRVKINAVERLRAELSRLEPEIISCGDWQQPAEARYRLSRKMLEVVLEARFPLLVIERSPLLLRDVDLLQEIHRQSWAGVLVSLSGLDVTVKRAFEPYSPGVKRRLQMMETLASQGIPVGAALMPVLPFLGDDPQSLGKVIRAVREHGGSFVLAGSLTMDGPQAELVLGVVRKHWPDLEARWRALYQWKEGGSPAYAPPRWYTARLGRVVRQICQELGLRDRLPRYVLPGPRAVNKRAAEFLHLRAYTLELEEAPLQRVWAYRKAAWTVEELSEDLGELYRQRGEEGLRALPHVGKSLARRLAQWLEVHLES